MVTMKVRSTAVMGFEGLLNTILHFGIYLFVPMGELSESDS